MRSIAKEKNSLLDVFYEEFATILNIEVNEFEEDSEFATHCKKLVNYISSHQVLPLCDRKRAFLAHVNWKFRVNSDYLAEFYKRGAKLGQTFNYHQKCAIQQTFDRCEIENISQLLCSFDVKPPILSELINYANCASVADTRSILHSELDAPSKLRKEAESRNIRQEILKSLFASFLWVSLPQRDMHRFFDIDFNESKYCNSFWDELQLRSPRLFHRNEAVHFIIINESWYSQFSSFKDLRDAILCSVRNSYEDLNNYGYLIVLIQEVNFEGRDVSWELAADITLFGEKHIERPLDRAYFRHERISTETVEYNSHIDVSEAHFELVNEGFTYRDCFILKKTKVKRIEQLLVFQKNYRDETIVPCPTCRSSNVEGNSYPSLGVKSWECRNPLCPDRSKYNRGKRYSFRGLAMQQAIDDERNTIPLYSIKQWRRDVVEINDYSEILEMIIRHYSIWNDHIRCFGSFDEYPSKILGRLLHWEPLSEEGDGSNGIWFEKASFFKRYGVSSIDLPSAAALRLGDNYLQVFCGDSRYVLNHLDSESVDGAVTSPPYYNARDYSQWPNIYCYLQDMFEVNTHVFRLLKPGSLYFYNIFDYFDNENNVVFSAMGKKRITLSAYTVDLFRRIGFECVGNIVWDKGEIEGKRGYNAGNFSPFYQSPFNCWEHVLVFRKPSSDSFVPIESYIMQAKPVLKMVRGKNIHGHTAPFPDDIPNLCIRTLNQDSIILDPFAGSLTTGRAAVASGLRAICIEQNKEYCELGLKLYKSETESLQMQLMLQ